MTPVLPVSEMELATLYVLLRETEPPVEFKTRFLVVTEASPASVIEAWELMVAVLPAAALALTAAPIVTAPVPEVRVTLVAVAVKPLLTFRLPC